MSEEKGTPRKAWEDLLLGAFEKIAAAPSKLNNPKEAATETIGAAVDWVKSMRDDVQSRIAADLSERLAQIDWEALGKKVGEHLAEHYDVEVTAKVRFKKKTHDEAP